MIETYFTIHLFKIAIHFTKSKELMIATKNKTITFSPKKIVINFCSEARRRCNNSKLLYILFGIYGRDRFTVFFHKIIKSLENQL